ncbi:MAG: hypothetical protein WC119_10965 [Synergistaceae bacterium]|jgi:hypothetical protein
MIPRMAKFVSMGGFVTFFAEMPVSPADRARVHKMWVDDHSYIEPFPRGHRIFDRHPCSIEEARAAGLRGWWAEADA